MEKTKKANTLTTEVFTKAETLALRENVNGIVSAFDCTRVNDENTALLFLKTIDGIGERTFLPYCKIFQKVRDNGYYKQGKSKTFEAWAKNNFNVGKVTASYRARVGEWVTDRGDKTILASENGDFNYTQITLFIENKKTPDEVAEMLKNGTITYDITAKALKKLLKPASGQDLAELGGSAEVVEENTENTADEKENEKKIQNAEKCNQYKRGCRMLASMLSENMAYMDTEKYKVVITFEKI